MSILLRLLFFANVKPIPESVAVSLASEDVGNVVVVTVVA
jgi:hypothetical protein